MQDMQQIVAKMTGTAGPGAGPLGGALPNVPGQGNGFDGLLDRGPGDFNGTSEDLAYYFQLQAEIARETLMFQTLSNMLKARQDASLNSVRNMRQ